MKTVKEVSKLTGISIRMLHYYDEIGLLKPNGVTKAGYRLYDDENLEDLQQILFFKELDMPLKEIKKIMENVNLDKAKILKEQKHLLIMKRDRLNGLIDIIDNRLKGDKTIEFSAFDKERYYRLYENFRDENKDRIIKEWGSIENFNKVIDKIKEEEEEKAIFKQVNKQFGNLDNYMEYTEKLLGNEKIKMERDEINRFEQDFFEGKNLGLDKLYKELTYDLDRESNSNEIQRIARSITEKVKSDYAVFRKKDKWYYVCRIFSMNQKWRELTDKKYGEGASDFISRVFKISLGDNKPKLEILYDELILDISKNPTSKEIQKIVKEIVSVTRGNQERYIGKTKINYKVAFSNMGDMYLSNINKGSKRGKYSDVEREFIGKAFKYYGDS